MQESWKQHFYVLFKASNCSRFIMFNLKCLGLSGSTTINLCSRQKLYVIMALGVSSVNKVLPWLQTSNTLRSITFLSTYRYIRILCYSIALRDDSYTIILIFVCRIAHVSSLQSSYLLIFCLHLILETYVLKLDGSRLVIMVCNGKLVFSLYSSDGLLMIFLRLVVSCRRTWGNNTLQQCFLKFFAFGCWLENNSSYNPSSLM